MPTHRAPASRTSPIGSGSSIWIRRSSSRPAISPRCRLSDRSSQAFLRRPRLQGSRALPRGARCRAANSCDDATTRTAPAAPPRRSCGRSVRPPSGNRRSRAGNTRCARARRTAPALRAIWPFDGAMAELLQESDGVIVETYPTEAYRRLTLHMGSPSTAKTRQEDRRADTQRILDWYARGQCGDAGPRPPGHRLSTASDRVRPASLRSKLGLGCEWCQIPLAWCDSAYAK